MQGSALPDSISRTRDFWINEVARVSDWSYHGRHKLVSPEEIIDIHCKIAEFCFRRNLPYAGIGIKDVNIFISSCFRQIHIEYSTREKAKSNQKFYIIATLFFGIARNHPFVDANKRTALLVLLYHMHKYKLALKVSRQAVHRLVIDLVEHRLQDSRSWRRKDRFKNYHDEIDIIANFLRRYKREIDENYRSITYNQLRTRLQHIFDECVFSPLKGNRVKILVRQGRVRRQCIIGFRSWTSIIPKSDLRKLRKEIGLILPSGFDMRAIVGIEDPIEYLLTRYEEPLEKLAYL